MPKKNIILFGESGSGKSSIVNMLSTNEHVADISSGAKGCTFKSRDFEVDVLGQPMTLWDTAGLDEGDAGRVPKSEAIVQLYKLVRNLSDGVSLLIFVMRAPRIKSSVPQNWKLFHKIICQKKVPIVIAITGLEQEENMDQWWWDNKGTFQDYGVIPVGFACITASRGKALKRGDAHVFDEEYEDSQKKMRELIRSTALVTPWRVPAAEWFKNIVYTTVEQESDGWCGSKEVRREHTEEVAGGALKKLVSVCGMSDSDAAELAGKMRGI
ncbi:hypothetical protein P691DRAFT_677374 [Macrolepiota fuliginosa MF-IS2]|uniref:G domain-containing protein n=1 Tax=Macrolepiota fuliginosa MF-IS2 TaxID=1400762 RepID=A0A9P5X7G7_9AGAR|nr:hypothetical protein P691DRAFT_677374 [Macrolepiota fuliginosa MF-IS2]